MNESCGDARSVGDRAPRRSAKHVSSPRRHSFQRSRSSATITMRARLDRASGVTKLGLLVTRDNRVVGSRANNETYVRQASRPLLEAPLVRWRRAVPRNHGHHRENEPRSISPTSLGGVPRTTDSVISRWIDACPDGREEDRRLRMNELRWRRGLTHACSVGGLRYTELIRDRRNMYRVHADIHSSARVRVLTRVSVRGSPSTKRRVGEGLPSNVARQRSRCAPASSERRA